jgi:hypothetical protein
MDNFGARRTGGLVAFVDVVQIDEHAHRRGAFYHLARIDGDIRFELTVDSMEMGRRMLPNVPADGRHENTKPSASAKAPS